MPIPRVLVQATVDSKHYINIDVGDTLDDGAIIWEWILNKVRVSAYSIISKS